MEDARSLKDSKIGGLLEEGLVGCFGFWRNQDEYRDKATDPLVASNGNFPFEITSLKHVTATCPHPWQTGHLVALLQLFLE